MVAFTGGEGAPVVVVECEEVLQLGRGKGVRKLQEIARIGGLGRSSPGNGGRYQRSAGIRVREGLPVAGGGFREEWVTEERMAFWAHFEVAGRRRGREGKREGEGGGGPAAGGPRGMGRRCGAWPRPAGGSRQRLERGAPRARCRLEPERLNLTGGPRHSAGRLCH
jgi:hypothetical protein